MPKEKLPQYFKILKEMLQLGASSFMTAMVLGCICNSTFVLCIVAVMNNLLI